MIPYINVYLNIDFTLGEEHNKFYADCVHDADIFHGPDADFGTKTEP